MKKIVSLVAVGLLAASAFSGTAVAGKKKSSQKVDGHILFQAPPADATDNPAGCYAGVHRRSAVATQEQVNGVVGYHFNIDKKTWGSKFRLTPTTADVDIDITFYDGFGTTEQATDTSYAPFTVSFEERNTEGEFGKVPAKMTKAIVCMKVGNNANFSYAAGSKVK